MNETTFEKLGFYQLKEKILEHCSGEISKNLIRNLKPGTDLKTVQNRLKETTEARNILDARGQVPLIGVRGIDTALESLEKGVVMEPRTFMEFYDFLRGCRKMKSFLEENIFYAPTLANYAGGLVELPLVEEEIYRTIRANEVDSSASKTLKNIRTRMVTVEEKIQEKLNRFLKHPGNKLYLQESYISQKNDRFTVPIKASYKNQVAGTVVEVSAKGTTVFIEPDSVSKLQSELTNLKVEETMEVFQILAALSGLIHENIRSIQGNLELIAHFDMVFAKGKYSRSIDGMEPKVNNHNYIKIIQGKHPLLEGDVVPLDFEIGKDYRSLIITGPNAGGKTVVLKTVGLLTLAVMCGFHVGADKGSEFSLFDNIFVDLGDDQSMENALSTFSSHMKNISSIMKQATPNTLLLFDEIGSGTEPNEGAALAIAILERFYKTGCITVATTHYGEIKEFGEKHPDFKNAAMLFEVDTLEPLYKLLIGKSGESNALWIAGKMSLPGDVLKQAKHYIINKDYSLEKIDQRKVRKPEVEEENLSDRYEYQIGDRVKVADEPFPGIIYREEDKYRNVKVFIQGEVREFNRKRLTLEETAKELYPDGYDMDSLFTDFSARKLERDIARGSKKALKKIRKEREAQRKNK